MTSSVVKDTSNKLSQTKFWSYQINKIKIKKRVSNEDEDRIKSKK